MQQANDITCAWLASGQPAGDATRAWKLDIIPKRASPQQQQQEEEEEPQDK